MENSSQKLQSMFSAATGDVRRLDDVIRFSSIPVVVHELVSTHQYWVGLYAALIHSSIRPDDSHLLGRIMVKAATHDLIEGWTGDFVRTFKYSSEKLRSAISEAEDDLIASLPEELRNLYSQGEENDEDQAYVDALVKAADFMALHQYMTREWMRGNRSIQVFFDRMISDLRKMQQSLDGRIPCMASLAVLYGIMADEARNVRI